MSPIILVPIFLFVAFIAATASEKNSDPERQLKDTKDPFMEAVLDLIWASSIRAAIVGIFEIFIGPGIPPGQTSGLFLILTLAMTPALYVKSVNAASLFTSRDKNGKYRKSKDFMPVLVGAPLLPMMSGLFYG